MREEKLLVLTREDMFKNSKHIKLSSIDASVLNVGVGIFAYHDMAIFVDDDNRIKVLKNRYGEIINNKKTLHNMKNKLINFFKSQAGRYAFFGLTYIILREVFGFTAAIIMEGIAILSAEIYFYYLNRSLVRKLNEKAKITATKLKTKF